MVSIPGNKLCTTVKADDAIIAKEDFSAPVQQFQSTAEPIAIDEANGEETEELRGVEKDTGLAILVRYKKSFTAKLIQSPDETKEYYGKLKNALLSYTKTTSRISWNYDSINSGRTKIAKFNVRGKTLYLYLALNPNDFANTKYKVEGSDSKKYEDTPCSYKIKNDRSAKYASDLIAVLAEKVGLLIGEEQTTDYYISYETTEALIKQNLIKEMISKENYEEYLRRTNQSELNSKKRSFVSANEVNETLRDEVASALVEKKQSSFIGKKVKGIVNIDSISEKYTEGEIVNLETLKAKGLLEATITYYKVLARGTLDKQLKIESNEYSIEAVKMVLLTGGSVIKLS